jgi:hypothetical protein
MKNSKIIIIAIAILISGSIHAQVINKDTLLPRVKEFGIGFSGLTSFSLQYRWGNTKRLFRVNATIGGSTAFGKGSNGSTQIQDTISSSVNVNSSKTKTPLNFTAGLSFSILHVKYIVEKFGLMYGPVAGVSYSTLTTETNGTGITANYYLNFPINSGTYPNSSTTKNHSETIQPYVGFVLGAVYKINTSFLLYAEIAPNVYYARTNSTTNTTNYDKSPNNYYSTNNNNSSNSNNTFGLASLTNSGATITLVYRITK